jgi:hypothetical protein
VQAVSGSRSFSGSPGSILWPVPDGEFDIVFCSEVLAAPNLTLTKVTRRLKPSGRLIVTYAEHGSPHNSGASLATGFIGQWGAAPGPEVVHQGGIRSSTGAVVLVCLELSMTRTGGRMLVLGLLMPL